MKNITNVTLPRMIRENLSLATNRAIMESPVGDLTFLFYDTKLLHILFTTQKQAVAEALPIYYNNQSKHFKKIKLIFDAYFMGEKVNFSVLDVIIQGSSFQRKVFENLPSIPYGSTMNYSEFSSTYFSPLHNRAVSNQIAKNPLPIMFPCHRVIGKNGSLKGFSGGLEVQKKLLELEGVIINN